MSDCTVNGSRQGNAEQLNYWAVAKRVMTQSLIKEWGTKVWLDRQPNYRWKWDIKHLQLEQKEPPNQRHVAWGWYWDSLTEHSLEPWGGSIVHRQDVEHWQYSVLYSTIAALMAWLWCAEDIRYRVLTTVKSHMTSSQPITDDYVSPLTPCINTLANILECITTIETK